MKRITTVTRYIPVSPSSLHTERELTQY